MSKMKKNEIEGKLKRERVEVCMTCKHFVDCDDIGKFEICGKFCEVEDEVWIIKKS